MATTWVNFNNGDTGSAVRTALNSFNTGTNSDMLSAENRLTANEGRLTNTEAATTVNTGDISVLDGRVTTTELDIVALESPQTRLQLLPTAVSPTYSEGSINYNLTNNSFELQAGYSDVVLQVGEEMHLHVVNNTLTPIPRGAACRADGVAGGIVQVEPALADTFDNARVLGVATHNIGAGEEGILTTFGLVDELNTTGLDIGVPLFLSDTVPGEWQVDAPDIITQVGGIFEADALVGRLFVSIINNKNLPTVFGSMQGQTVGNDTYSLTGVEQNIDDFLQEDSVVIDTNLLTGIITVPNEGRYRMSYSALASFLPSTQTRTVTVELYDITNAVVKYSYVKNIPRDSTEDSFSFGWPFPALVGNQYKLRIKASANFDVTFENISFDLTSISII